MASQSRGPEINAITITFTVVSVIMVLVRFVSRKVSGAGFWWDDWVSVPTALESGIRLLQCSNLSIAQLILLALVRAISLTEAFSNKVNFKIF